MNRISDKSTPPVFLFLTMAIPLGQLLLTLIYSLKLIFMPDHSGGNIGGNASASEYFSFFGTCGGVLLIGVILGIISSARKERFLGHGIGFWTLCIVPMVVLIINVLVPAARHIAYP